MEDKNRIPNNTNGWIIVSTLLFLCSLAVVTIVVNTYGTGSNRKSIIVGMTYDDVETILGKPSRIERGATQMQFDLEGSGLSPVPRQKLKPLTLQNDPDYFPGVYYMENVGSLIYVSWVYESDSKRHYPQCYVYDYRTHKQTRLLDSLDYYKTIVFDAAGGRVAFVGYNPDSEMLHRFRKP